MKRNENRWNCLFYFYLIGGRYYQRLNQSEAIILKRKPNNLNTEQLTLNISIDHIELIVSLH